MTNLFQKISLKEYNTFGIDVEALYSFFCYDEKDLISFLRQNKIKKSDICVIGGGSNILPVKNINDILVLMRNKGIKIIEENKNDVFVKVEAGEIWDDFVDWCVRKEFWGTENLSSIPGTVGAAPVQNIGAYGAEVKNVIYKVNTVDTRNGKTESFRNEQCDFGYRNSFFKSEEGKNFIVTSVIFKLSKNPEPDLSYGSLKNKFPDNKAKIEEIRKAVTEIRKSKLPDPKILPNAGSFFKNPVISEAKFTKLRKKFPGLVYYPAEDGKIKLAAGQLIDLCGWKGKQENGAGVHDKQALVIVNYGNADGNTILEFSKKIQQSVYDKFGVLIEREVRVLP